MSDAQAMAARLKAEMEILRAQLAWTEQALFAVLNDEPVDGQYIHALTCSGDRTKPIGTVGVTCSCGLGRRYKELQQSLAAATTERERLEKELADQHAWSETFHNDAVSFASRATKAEAQRDAAYEALRTYGEHLPECLMRVVIPHEQGQRILAGQEPMPPCHCTCGLDAALQSVPPQPQKETK